MFNRHEYLLIGGIIHLLNWSIVGAMMCINKFAIIAPVSVVAYACLGLCWYLFPNGRLRVAQLACVCAILGLIVTFLPWRLILIPSASL